MGVNEVTSSGDQHNELSSGTSAGYDGDSGNVETVQDTRSSEQKDTTSLPICKECNFVFVTQAALEKHEVQ